MKFSSPQSSTNCLETAESGDPHIFTLENMQNMENMQFVSIFLQFASVQKVRDVSDRAELVLVTARRRTEHKQRCNQYRHIGATISAIVILQICLIQLSTAFRDIHSAR